MYSLALLMLSVGNQTLAKLCAGEQPSCLFHS